MNKYCIILCLFFLFNCSKKEVFQISETIDAGNSLDFVETIGGSKNDAFSAVKATLDGGYITAGFTQSNNGDITSKTDTSFDFLISKFSSENTLEWQNTYGGSEDDKASAVIQTLDSGFLVLGHSKSSDLEVSANAGSKDFWLLKLSNEGVVIWEKSFGFSGADYGTNLLAASDGGYLITGVLDVSASNGQGNSKSGAIRHAGGDYWVIKTDPTGNLQWSSFFGGSFTEVPLGIVETDDNNFILAGSSDSNDFNISNSNGSYDFWITKIASDGSLIWEKSFGGSEIDEARGITATNEGDFIIVGDTRSSDKNVSINNGAADVWILKISKDGDILWEKTIGGTSFDVARGVSRTQDNGFLIAGSSRSLDNGFENKGQNDALILKIDTNGKLLWQKTVGGSEIDFLYAVAELQNKSIIAVGESSSSDQDVSENKGFTDALIIQLK
jgi:hypothetical protein